MLRVQFSIIINKVDIVRVHIAYNALYCILRDLLEAEITRKSRRKYKSSKWTDFINRFLKFYYIDSLFF